jgi:DNA polymerase III subunit alpha
MADLGKDEKSELNNQFVHLRAVSSTSMDTSLLSLEDIIKLAHDDKMSSVAVTDIGRMFGTIKHIKKSKEKGMKPIIGVEVFIKPTGLGEKYDEHGNIINPELKEYTQGVHSVLLLCNTAESYKYLMRLVSNSWLRNQVKDVPYVLESDIEAIKKQDKIADGQDLGFVVLLGGQKTWLGQQLSSETSNPAFRNSVESVEWMKKLFGNDSVKIELQRIAHTDEEAKSEFDWINRSIAVCNKTGIEYVATHPFLFRNREDWYANELRTHNCVGDGVYSGDQLYATPEQHWLTAEQMKERFSDLPKAISNVEKLSSLLGNNPPMLGKYFLPDFPVEENAKIDFNDLKEGSSVRTRLETLYQKIPANELEGLSEEEKEHKIKLSKLLTRKSWDGFLERMKEVDAVKDDENLKKTYMNRFFYETEMIVSMGFTGYFLIVSDFIQWAKNNDIPVGPGRGSGAGSLVAWSLKITDLDPIPYGLLFERFLNPERVSMPDFDIDFCKENRGRVVEYVKDKYGRDKVGQIATVSTAKARGSINLVGRTIYGNEKGARNQYMDLAKLVPEKPVDIKLKTALKEKKNFRHEYRTDIISKQIVDLAMRIEGTPLNPGKGAAGLVISPTTLDAFSPLYIDQKILNEYTDSADAPIVCQYDKEYIEYAGLVKFDFLGLATLTIIDQANKRVGLNLNKLDIKDPATYRLIMAGNTIGIFQIESNQMQDLMKNIKPNKIEELLALIALYRPGPMDLIPTFAARKNGEEPVEYPDPRTEDILKETYGVMVYQEQVMQMAQIIGGYTLGGADLLRRAMGKKKPEEMIKHRAVFREGAMKNGLTQEKADSIFDLMEKFAGYGFNKSHAAAYALITFQTAYLKTHYPLDFYSALMTNANENPIKVAKFRRDALSYVDFTGATPVAKPIRLLAPDINYSPEKQFAPSERIPNAIEYSLIGLKSINKLDVKFIVHEREQNGLYTSLEDFVKRCYKKINVTSFKILTNSGALDNLIPDEVKPQDNRKPWSGREWLSENADVIFAYIKALKKEESKTPGGVMKMPKISDENGDLFSGMEMTKPKRQRKSKERVAKEVLWPADQFRTPEKFWTEVEAMSKESTSIGYEFSGSIANYYHSLFSSPDGGGLTFSDMESLTKDHQDGKLGRDYANKHMIQGVPFEIRRFTTKTGQAMASVIVDDGYDLYKIVIFPDQVENIPDKFEKLSWVSINCSLPWDKKRNNNKDKEKDKEKKKKALDDIKIKNIDSFDDGTDPDHHAQQENESNFRETQEFTIAASDFFTESDLFERWASGLLISRKVDFSRAEKILTEYASPDNTQNLHNIPVKFSGTNKVAYIIRDYRALKGLLDAFGDDKIRVHMRPLSVNTDAHEVGGNKIKDSKGYDPRNQNNEKEDTGIGPVSKEVIELSKSKISNVLKFKEDHTNEAVNYQKNEQFAKHDHVPHSTNNGTTIRKTSTGFRPRGI